MSTVKTYPDAPALADAAARLIVERAAQVIALRQRFSIALSGGSTPRATYARLAEDDLAAQVDWARVHVFWGDERAVPPDHADSNYRMACEAWLDHVPILPQNVHRIRGEMSPEAAAAEYEGELRAFFAAQKRQDEALTARFDLLLLGMGDDGHTASLFPGASAIHEPKRWVEAYYVEKLDTWRITLTPPAINAAAQVAFLVAGAKKAARLRQVLYGLYKPDVLPSQVVRPKQGRLLWLLDEAASTGREPAPVEVAEDDAPDEAAPEDRAE